MPSETAVCPLSPDNTSKHRFSPLAWGAEHWRDATISRQLNTPSASRLRLVHTNTDTHTPALTHILAGDKRSQPRTKWGKLGSGVNEHSSHLFSECYSGAPSVSPSKSRHLRLYMRAVKHIPQVTHVPHRRHWAHQQTARDMKSWLRVKSSAAEMCETAARHSWGPDTLSLSDYCLRWQWTWRSKSTWQRACCWDPNRRYPVQKNGTFDKDTEQEPEAEMTHCISGHLFTPEWKQL